MGNPAFYYYPDEYGTLEVVDLGAHRLSDLIVGQAREATDAVSRAGTLYRDAGGMRLVVRIIVERFSDDALVRDLSAMSSHLERGGVVGFTRDTDRAWGAFVDTSATMPVRGTTRLATPGGNAWAGWAPNNPPTGGEVAIQSAHPESVFELDTIAGWGLGGAWFDLSGGLRYTRHVTPVLARWRDFFPALKMPDSQVGALSAAPMVQSHRRLNHTLDVTLIEDWGAIQAAQSTGVWTGITLESKIKRYDRLQTQINVHPHARVGIFHGQD